MKSAIQLHFICVDSCMTQLQEVSKNLNTVRATIYSIEDDYKTISHLETTLHDLRKEAYKHKQLKSAIDNMKNILDFDELVNNAYNFLEQNQLLHAHQYLVQIEQCRNDILMELGDSTETNLSDIKVGSSSIPNKFILTISFIS
jgi:exocyst complex component 3